MMALDEICLAIERCLAIGLVLNFDEKHRKARAKKLAHERVLVAEQEALYRADVKQLQKQFTL